jgi:ABC-type phosphate transport system substrate-binding protein
MKKYQIFFVLFLLLGCQKPIEQPSFTMETYPRIDGSTVTIPLSEAICAKLTGQTIEQVRPYILHTKTHSAYINLIDKTTDLIFVTYPSADELKYAQDSGVELEIVPIVSEAFVFLTHKNNPVESLTLKQIQDIYSGTITNWKDVGGPDLAVTVVFGTEIPGTQAVFQKQVMDGENYAEKRLSVAKAPDVKAKVIATTGSIGLAPISLVDATVSVPSIPEIGRPITLVTRGEPSPLVLKMIQYIAGPGKKHIAK